MVDERLARLRTHRNHILRYRKLLNTKLLEHERLYILKRISEEQTAIEELASPSVRLTAKALSPPERRIV
jgi:hypothetical protein